MLLPECLGASVVALSCRSTSSLLHGTRGFLSARQSASSVSSHSGARASGGKADGVVVSFCSVIRGSIVDTGSRYAESLRRTRLHVKLSAGGENRPGWGGSKTGHFESLKVCRTAFPAMVPGGGCSQRSDGGSGPGRGETDTDGRRGRGSAGLSAARALREGFAGGCSAHRQPTKQCFPRTRTKSARSRENVRTGLLSGGCGWSAD